MMRIRKPIIQIKGSDHHFKYRNCFIGWALSVPIEIETDLSRMQFNRFLDGRYNRKEIERFEISGRF